MTHDNVTDIETRLRVVYGKLTPGAIESADLDGMAFTVADAITDLSTLRKQLENARSEALEEAAKACEGQRYTQAGVDASFRDGDGRAGDHNDTCDELADAIRALKGQP